MDENKTITIECPKPKGRKTVAKKSNWKTFDMSDRNEKFVLKRRFTDKQMEILHYGNIPREMEDKWFWYMEGNTLYAHRSWTGFCVYVIEFGEGDEHQVTVNRNPEQYSQTNVSEDIVTLNKLLDWWCKYDYYSEWLSETVDNLKRAGAICEDE